MGNFLEQYDRMNRFFDAFNAATDDLLLFNRVDAVNRFLAQPGSLTVSGIKAALHIESPVGLDDVKPAGVPRGKFS